MLCSSCWYIIGPTFLFFSRGFPFFVAPAFSAPAFSTPVTYSRIFHSYIFHPCCLLLIFHSYFFHSCIFSVPSVWHGSLTVNVRYERHSVLPMELSGLGRWTQQFMCTDAHFWVKLGFKLRPLGKISNISTSDAPPPVLLGQFQHCSVVSFRRSEPPHRTLAWLSQCVSTAQRRGASVDRRDRVVTWRCGSSLMSQNGSRQSLMPTTRAQQTCRPTRTLCKSSGTRNLQHVCRSIWYKFFSGTNFLHAIEHSSIPAQKLCGTWHKPGNVIGRRVLLVQETVMKCVKFLMHVS